jgi:thioesterase domain-containing protein
VARAARLRALEERLRRTIPLTGAMDVQVTEWDDEGLRLRAPLAPNANHHGTLFGGAASALAILAGWSLVHLRLGERGLDPDLVIQRSAMEFEVPARGEVEATAIAPDPPRWDRFLRALDRWGRARIEIRVELWAEGIRIATLQGAYVALTPPA